jgi:uncharacterized protein YcbK (DUF882 family)
MTKKLFSNKDILIILGLGLTMSVIVALLIFKKTNIMGEENEIDYSKYYNDKYRWYKDKKTLNLLNKLHPKYRNKIAEFFSKIEDELGYTAFITSGYRSFKEQQILHNQNSQNAKAGYSSHNFGFAVDINVKDKKGVTFLKKANTSKKWRDSGVIPLSEKLNLLWGGDGNFGSYHDPIHFYIKPNNLSTSELRAMVNGGKKDNNGYVLV